MPEVSAHPLSIRPAAIADHGRLYEIHRSALGPYVAELWGWDDAWQADHFAKGFEPSRFQVVECDGEVAGFFATLDDAHGVMLSTIEIDPKWQGRGLGSRIIRDLIARAQNTGRQVRLQVFQVNRRARDLYGRLGFIETGETASHVQMATPARP